MGKIDLLVLYTFVGVLIRIIAGFYPGYLASQSLPQFIGCFIFGYVDIQRGWLIQKHPNLLLGLTAGLCGSITSFSNFALGLYGAFGGLGTNGFDFISGINYFCIIIGLSYVSFRLGRHLGDYIPFEVIESYQCGDALIIAMTFVPDAISLGVLVASLTFIVLKIQTVYSYAMVFAPFGTLVIPLLIRFQ